MKTSIKNLIAVSLTTLLLSASAFASDVKDVSKNVTVLNDVKNITSIRVSGNVELILVQSFNESVKVYDNYYAKNALVQQQNGELFISSFESEKLTVVAYVNQVSSITATDNASVSTFKKFNLLSLNIKLQSNATAEMDVNVVNLRTDVSGTSQLSLAGSATEMNANIESIARLNLEKFNAETSNITSKNRSVAKVISQDEFSEGGLGK